MTLAPVAHLTGIFAPLELFPMLIAAALYARRATTLAARGRRCPSGARPASPAVLCIVGALITPLSGLADELVIAHMIEHLLVGDIAGLLIVLGLTGPLLQPILAIRTFDRLRLLDLAYTHGVELDPDCAQRAVAAGRGTRTRLEEQIIGGARRDEFVAT